MKIYAKNNTLVCEPYELKGQDNGLFVTLDNSNTVAKIIDLDMNDTCGTYNRNDIIVYDTKYVKECVICGKKYLMIPRCNVLAVIKEDE